MAAFRISASLLFARLRQPWHALHAVDGCVLAQQAVRVLAGLLVSGANLVRAAHRPGISWAQAVMPADNSSFTQCLSALVEEFRKRIIVEHERDLKRKLEAALEENADFRERLGLSPKHADEAGDDTELHSIDSDCKDELHLDSVSKPAGLFSLSPRSSGQGAKKAPPPPPPKPILKSALKKQRDGGRNSVNRLSRRCSSQPATRQGSMLLVDIEKSLQKHKEEMNFAPTPSTLAAKLEVIPPMNEPESLGLRPNLPCGVAKMGNDIRTADPPSLAPNLPHSPVNTLSSPVSSPRSARFSQNEGAMSQRSSDDWEVNARGSMQRYGSEGKNSGTGSTGLPVLSEVCEKQTDRPPVQETPSRQMRPRRSFSHADVAALELRSSSKSDGDRETSPVGRQKAEVRGSQEKKEASHDQLQAGNSFVSELPSFKRSLGRSKTQTYDEQDGKSDRTDERRFSWLSNGLFTNLKRGSSFTASRNSSRSNSLIAGSRKTSAILQAVKNLHVRFNDGKGDDDTSSEEDQQQHDDTASVASRMSFEEDEAHHFWLSPIWLEKNEQVKTVRKTASNVNLIVTADENDALGVEELRGASSRIGRCLEPFVIHPRSGPRMLWALCGCFLYLYDAIAIPLQFFRLDFPMQRVIRWIVCIYWTIDVPLSFINGTVQQHGTIELRPEKIVLRYTRSWLLIDVFMVVMDWVQLAKDNESSEWGLIRVGKVARTTRMFRLFWFIKLMQTVSLPEQLRVYLLNERFIILVDIVKIIIFIVGVNHLIACFWYGIGNNNQQYSWVNQEEYRDSDSGDFYAVSFLWSLSQFTGSLDINMPRNVNERAFSIFVLLFTFVFSAFAISSITSSMTQLQIITAQQSRQFAALRLYLNANSISKALAMRIHRSARNAVEDLAKNTPERSVELLQLVSDPLRQELHFEVHAPNLMVHPFFKYYHRVYSHAMVQICHNAVSHLALHRGDLLFSHGEMPPDEELRMFFLTTGRLNYMHHEKYPTSVKAGAWACEAAIWTVWPYHGTMRAKADCSLTLLDACKFQKIACQFMSRNVNPVLYGKEFVKSLNEKSRIALTDLDIEDFDTDEVARSVFLPQESVEQNGRRSSSEIRLSGVDSMMNGGWIPMIGKRLSRLTETMERQSNIDRASAMDRASSVHRTKSLSTCHLVVPPAAPSQRSTTSDAADTGRTSPFASKFGF